MPYDRDDNLFHGFPLWVLHKASPEGVSLLTKGRNNKNVLTYLRLYPSFHASHEGELAVESDLTGKLETHSPKCHLNGESLRRLFWHLILVSWDRWIRKLSIVWWQTIKRGHYCGPPCMHWLVLYGICESNIVDHLVTDPQQKIKFICVRLLNNSM